MKSMKSAEVTMEMAWKRGLRTRNWKRMEGDVAASLLQSFNSGRGLFLPEVMDSTTDLTPFFERARLLTMRAQEEVIPKYQKIDLLYGDEMAAILYLLFFDDDDPTVYRPVRRGVPTRISRRAAAMDIPMAAARRAQEIVSVDADARALVRTIPSRSLLVAQDEARRALNLGIADAAVGDGHRLTTGQSPSSPSTDIESKYPLWEVRELLDRRTRGNPGGDFPKDGYHWQVGGYINTIEEIIRQNCVPPCGRNCRATLVPVSSRKADKLSLLNSDGTIDFGSLRTYNGDRQGFIDRGQYPDPGF